MKESLNILKRVWGYDEFRPLQEDIVDNAINGKDILALLPTGGGKSICFQVPGLAREGVCIVISPLIALMQDQVDQLEKRGVRAKAITSLMSHREIDLTLDLARFGGLDFLYTSPERLKSRVFIDRFKQMNVSMIVVDEAHCISEWGHDFRPPYREIAVLRNYQPNVPMMAVTATATQEVKDDIIKQLELKNPAVFEASFTRENLSYEVYQVQNKESAVVKWIQKFPEFCGIIYCQTRKSVKELANHLALNGIQVGIYHGGLDAHARNEMMSNWLSNRTPIMVATNAFGMGIDKPDVRYVLHYEFPNNLEAYFQEAGRAGRDGKASRTLVLILENEMEKHKSLIEQQFPPLETIKNTYRAMCNYLHLAIGSGEGETFPIHLNTLCNTFRLELIPTFQSLKILEMNGDILFSESVFTPTKLKLLVGNTTLYSFQIKYDRVSKLISFLTRSYPGIFDYYFAIDEEFISKKIGVSESETIKQLEFLEQNGIVDISWKSDAPKVTFLHERLPDDHMRLTDEVYRNRKERAFNRFEKASQYISGNHCREQFLLAYFGQNSSPCGRCDYCKSQRKEQKTMLEIASIIVYQLKTAPKSFADLENQIGEFYTTEIKQALQHLMLEEKIKYVNQVYMFM
jgi:ATP-dependent DNA helicase RecQ